MREIKFRAWNKKNKRMLFYDLIHSLRWKDVKTLTEKSLNWKPFECEIMQFIGLKDKNGQEIFEGDIVSLLPLRIGDPTVYAEIKFEDGSFDMFGINRPVNTKQIRFVRELYVECITNHVEVIGNRFENPELLEDKK